MEFDVTALQVLEQTDTELNQWPCDPTIIG
jgi:hypothetical protein